MRAIDNLPYAGPELDALVSFHAMGHGILIAPYSQIWDGYAEKLADKITEDGWYIDARKAPPGKHWRANDEIGTKVSNTPWMVSLRWEGLWRDNPGFFAHPRGFGHTLPETLCRAAMFAYYKPELDVHE